MKYAEVIKKIDSWNYKIGDKIVIDEKEYTIIEIFPMPTAITKKKAFENAFNKNGLKLAIEHFMSGLVDIGYLLEDRNGNEFLIGIWEI